MMNIRHNNENFSPYSLAIFRMLLGAGLVFQLLFIKWPGLEYFLNTACFDIASMDYLMGLPRNTSVFHILDTPFGVQLFFTFSLICFTCLMLGVKSKWASLAALFCLWNINQRAFMLNSGWDIYAMAALTFSIFLPMDQKWAILPSNYSRRLLPRNLRLICWLAIAQISAIYIVSALTKSHPTWIAGTGFVNSINDKMLLRGLTPWLLTKPMLTTFLNYATIVLELFIGLSVLFYFKLPDWYKTGMALFLVLFHLSIVAMIDVEPFIFYTSACALLLLPSSFWQRMLPSWTGKAETVSNKAVRFRNLYRLTVPIFIGAILLANLHTLTGMSYVSGPLKKLKVRKVTSRIFPIPFEHASFLNQTWIFYSITLPDMGCVRLIGYAKDGAEVDLFPVKDNGQFCPYDSYQDKKFLSLLRVYILSSETKWVYDRWARCKMESVLTPEEIAELDRVEVLLTPQKDRGENALVVGSFDVEH